MQGLNIEDQLKMFEKVEAGRKALDCTARPKTTAALSQMQCNFEMHMFEFSNAMQF